MVPGCENIWWCGRWWFIGRGQVGDEENGEGEKMIRERKGMCWDKRDEIVIWF